MAKAGNSRLEARLIAKAWQDEAFRKRLIKSPRKVLTEEGVDVPAGVRIKVVQNTASQTHLVIPAKPAVKAGKKKGPRPPSRMGPTFTFG